MTECMHQISLNDLTEKEYQDMMAENYGEQARNWNINDDELQQVSLFDIVDDTCDECKNCTSLINGKCAQSVEEDELINGKCEDFQDKSIKPKVSDFYNINRDYTDDEMDRHF